MRRMRLLISLVLALSLTASSIASGVCVSLCTAQVCCAATPSASCPPVPECCKKKAAAKCERPAKAKKCCDWIAKSKTPDQVLAKYAFAPLVLDFVLPQLVVLPAPAVAVVAEERIPYEVRGPPGRDVAPHHSRAPPVREG